MKESLHCLQNYHPNHNVTNFYSTASSSSSSGLEGNYTNNDHKVDNAPTLFPLLLTNQLTFDIRSHVHWGHWELAVELKKQTSAIFFRSISLNLKKKKKNQKMSLAFEGNNTLSYQNGSITVF